MQHRHATNYISHYNTNTGTFHIYHDNIAFFCSQQLSDLIFPGLFYELKKKSKYPEMFEHIQSCPSKYVLPEHIHADTLTENLRGTLARTLVFIHTWANENPSEECRKIFAADYTSYIHFFSVVFKFILDHESDSSILDLTHDLQAAIIAIKPYLGRYHGNMGHCVCKTEDILKAVMCYIVSSLLT